MPIPGCRPVLATLLLATLLTSQILTSGGRHEPSGATDAPAAEAAA